MYSSGSGFFHLAFVRFSHSVMGSNNSFIFIAG